MAKFDLNVSLVDAFLYAADAQKDIAFMLADIRRCDTADVRQSIRRLRRAIESLTQIEEHLEKKP